MIRIVLSSTNAIQPRDSLVGYADQGASVSAIGKLAGPSSRAGSSGRSAPGPLAHGFESSLTTHRRHAGGLGPPRERPSTVSLHSS